MKRMILFFLMVSCAAALIFAQGNDRRDQNRSPGGPPPASRGNDNNSPRRTAESTSVRGNLSIAQGMIAVTSNDITYLVRGLNRFVGFIDGLKEGATVTLEGYAMPYPQNDKVRFFAARKMTLNGKEYELAPSIAAGPNRNTMPGHNVRPNHYPMPRHNQMPNRNMMPPQRYPYPPPRMQGRR